MAKRKRYDDKFRASAVVMLEAAGYPDQKGALQRVADRLKVPPSTLHRWFKGKNNPPPSELVTEKKGELKNLIRDEVYSILGDMPEAREFASYRDLGTVAGILLDKLQLLENKPTERVEHTGNLTVEERANRITGLLDAARDRRTRRATDD